LEDFKSSSKESSGRGCSVSKMLLEVTAIEDLHAGASVSLLFNDSNQIYCRKSFPTELPDAVAARVILKGDSITRYRPSYDGLIAPKHRKPMATDF
jgi:hypothetical protein